MNRLTFCIKPLLFAAALTALSAQGQNAPTNLFQIDGSAASDSLPCSYGPCDYWNLLNGNGQGANPGSPGSSSVRTFINGQASGQSFTGGGSKDPNDIPKWQYTVGGAPNKDTLNAGYAAAYTAPDGDFEVMFGADRASPSGAANIGIWFFQQSVGPNGSGGFTGAHTNHDIFVISAFTVGGGTSTISVYEWDSGCASGVKNPTPGQCSDTNLRLLASPTTVCGSSPYCAVTNSAPTTTSWEGQIASPLFFEGGVDITQALAAAGVNVSNLPCFSSFLEETRSSPSTSSVLKDFVSGGFPVCGLTISKACDAANTMLINNGTQVQFAWKGSVTNTGIGTLSNVTVNDTLPNGNVVNPTLKDGMGNTITSLGPKQTGSYAVTYNSTNLSETNTASATGFFGAASFSTPTPASATCTQTVSTALTVTKSCVAPGPGVSCSAAGCVISVPVRAKVCNTGNVQITGITLTDSPAATISPNGFTLNPGQCSGDTGAPAVSTGSYTPTTASGDGATNGRYTFSDTISITGAKATLGSLSTIPAGQMCAGTYGCAPASCPLCNAGECTTTALQ